MRVRLQVLVVHRAPSTFVRQDIALLGRHFNVRALHARSRLDPPPWAIAAAVLRADVVLCWFASWHAVLPLLLARLLRRPGLVVVGGYDVAALPEIGYGLQLGGPARALSRLALHAAIRVLPFSRAAFLEAQRNAGVPIAKLVLIPLGIPDAGPLPEVPRAIALTVGRVDAANLERKGLLDFARASRFLPEREVVIAGEIADEGAARTLREAGGPGLRLTGRVSDQELRQLYARAVAYVQLSRHEGFGLAVGEAMAAGCVPIVTRVGSLPELVGEVGEYVATPEEAASAVRRAALAGGELRERIAARVRDQFPLVRREDALHALVLTLVERNAARPRRRR